MAFQITEKKNPYQKPPKIPSILDKGTTHVLFLLIKLIGTLAIQVNELVYCGNKINNTQHGMGGGRQEKNPILLSSCKFI